jgi:hypothetical protein
MIFNFLLLIIIQPLIGHIFIFLAPLLSYFFKGKIKELNLSLIFLTLIADLIFIKQLGFFLLITSLSLLLISLLEKFLDHNYLYQKLIYLSLFNIVFAALFFFLGFGKITLDMTFLKVVIYNIIFQLLYVIIF